MCEDIEKHQSQNRPLRGTTHHWPSLGYIAIDQHSLGATFKPTPYPLNGLPTKSISLQFGDQDVMWDHVKDLTELQVDDIGWSSLVN